MIIYTLGVAVMAVLLYEAIRILRTDYKTKKLMQYSKPQLSRTFVELWQDATGMSSNDALLFMPIPGIVSVEYNVDGVPVIYTLEMDHTQTIICTECHDSKVECLHEKAVRLLLASTKSIVD